MKYDCSRILDYIHERDRICRTIGTCENCPLYALFRCDVSDATQETIDAVQRWSDSHPEKPKLTHEEYTFLKAFRVTADKNLGRRVGHMSLANGYSSMELRSSMFPFIKEGETWPLDELLKLEVEE